MASSILLYDADCGLCTRFKKALDFVDAQSNLEFMPIDDAEKIGLLDELPDVLRHSSFHLILPNKRLESGAVALPDLIRLLPTGRLVSKMILSVPGGRRVLNFLYSTVARLHEAGSCKMQSAASAIYVGSHNFSRREPLLVGARRP